MKNINEIKGMSSETIELLCQELEIRMKNQTLGDFNKEILEALIEYGRLVILGRAFPSVADGLKPVHRRILYAMKDLGLNDGPQHIKSAKIVGHCLGSFHPHGDASVYDAMVRLAQEFSLREPLVSGQGNFGTIEGDIQASARYTEATFRKAGFAFFNDINRDVIDFIPNYDETDKEPELLPVPYPNLLINGSFGIAVGMSSDMPPHNPKEVIELTQYLIECRKSGGFDIEKALDILPAPDFPTKGVVLSDGLREEMRKAMTTGRGKVTLRSSYDVEKNGRRESLVITDIPYLVKVPSIFSKISDLLANKNEVKELEIFKKSISEIRNESNRDGIRLVIDLKTGVKAENIYAMLKDILETNIFYRANVIDLDGKSKTMGLLDILESFIDFRVSIQQRKYEFIRDEALKNLNIVDGYLKTVDMIDEIIKIVRGSEDSDEAFRKIEALGFNQEQTTAILALRLSRLTKMEKIQLLKDKEKYEKTVRSSEKITKSDILKLNLIRDELSAIDYFDFERRSQIGKSVSFEGIVEDYTFVLSNIGYIKKETKEKPLSVENDFVKHRLDVRSNDRILFFSRDGMAYGLNVSDIPDKETFISNEIENEEIVSVLKYNEEDLLTLVSKNGFIKRVKMSDFSGAFRKGGIAAITLNNDELIHSSVVDGIISLISAESKIIRFDINEVPVVGRAARGVIGMRDAQIACVAFEKIAILFDGRVVGIDLEFPIQRRAGKGIFVNGKASKGPISCVEGDFIIIDGKSVPFKVGSMGRGKELDHSLEEI